MKVKSFCFYPAKLYYKSYSIFLKYLRRLTKSAKFPPFFFVIKVVEWYDYILPLMMKLPFSFNAISSLSFLQIFSGESDRTKFFCLNLQLNRSMMSLKDTKKSPPNDEKVIAPKLLSWRQILEHVFKRRGKTLFKFKSNSKYCLSWMSLTWKIWMKLALNHKLESSSKMS